MLEYGQRKLGFEIKSSTAPSPAKGFWAALRDLEPDHAYVVTPVQRSYPLAQGVEVVPVQALARLLAV